MEARRAEKEGVFLLTPLREGRHKKNKNILRKCIISTHAPAGGATLAAQGTWQVHQISTHAPAGGATVAERGEAAEAQFLLTPLREGRHLRPVFFRRAKYFYSRPCGRGDLGCLRMSTWRRYFYSRPCGRGDHGGAQSGERGRISTHAPAGGATQKQSSKSLRR